MLNDFLFQIIIHILEARIDSVSGKSEPREIDEGSVPDDDSFFLKPLHPVDDCLLGKPCSLADCLEGCPCVKIQFRKYFPVFDMKIHKSLNAYILTIINIHI